MKEKLNVEKYLQGKTVQNVREEEDRLIYEKKITSPMSGRMAWVEVCFPTSIESWVESYGEQDILQKVTSKFDLDAGNVARANLNESEKREQKRKAEQQKKLAQLTPKERALYDAAPDELKELILAGKL